MNHKGRAHLSTAAGLLMGMAAPVQRILAPPAALFLFLAFREYGKAALKWRPGLRRATHVTCGLMLLGAVLTFWLPGCRIWLWEVVALLGCGLGILVILRIREEPLSMTPLELVHEGWRAAGADDRVSRANHMHLRFGGMLYRVSGTVTHTYSDGEHAIVQVKWQPNAQTFPVFVDLYCSRRRYQAVSMGTAVVGWGRIRSVDGSAIELEDARFRT